MRHRGTANSSLTLRPSARGSAKRRWWASQGERPQTRQGWDATNSRCRLSRRRRVFGVACPGGWLGLEGCRMVVVVPGLAAFDNGRSARSAVGSLATISGVPSFAIFTSKALSIARASSEVRVFFSGSMRRAQTSSGSRAVNAASSPRRRPQRRTDLVREHRHWARSGDTSLWGCQGGTTGTAAYPFTCPGAAGSSPCSWSLRLTIGRSGASRSSSPAMPTSVNRP